MDISPRSFDRRLFIGRYIFLIDISLPVMLADTCSSGDYRNVDQVKVPKAAQLCLVLDCDIEWTAQLDGLVHHGRSRRFIGGINGIGDVLGTFYLRAEKVKKLFCLCIDTACQLDLFYHLIGAEVQLLLS